MDLLNSNNRSNRKNIQLKVEINFGQTSHKALTSNISVTGVAIVSDKAIFRDIGSSCRMRWYHQNKPFHIDCHVVRVYANKMALAFEQNRINENILNQLLMPPEAA